MRGAPTLKTANYSTSPMNPLSVLVLDDSEFDRTRMKRLIKQADRTVDVITCATLMDFQQALANHVVDVCLVDHQLQEASGLEAVAAVNQQMRTKNVPVIMISGREDTKVIVNSMRAGCVNYVGKTNLTAEKLHKVIFNSIADTFSSPGLASEVHEATKNVMVALPKAA